MKKSSWCYLTEQNYSASFNTDFFKVGQYNQVLFLQRGALGPVNLKSILTPSPFTQLYHSDRFQGQ